MNSCQEVSSGFDYTPVLIFNASSAPGDARRRVPTTNSHTANPSSPSMSGTPLAKPSTWGSFVAGRREQDLERQLIRADDGSGVEQRGEHEVIDRSEGFGADAARAAANRKTARAVIRKRA